jgi:stage II sporulation SpoD-like protein
MKRLLFFITSLTLSALQGGPTNSVKVQVLQRAEGALVEVKGSYNVFDPYADTKLDTAYSHSSYYLYPTKEGLKWGQEFPGTYQMKIVPDKVETTVMVAGTEYKGSMYLYNVQGAVGAVNEVSVEDFVLSGLSTHVPVSVHSKELFALLAIAMRTEVYSAKAQAKNPYWEVKASYFDYRGCAEDRHDPLFTHAVRATKDMVLKNTNGEYTPIRWFAAGASSVPYEKLQEFAAQGKNAKEILESLFDKSRIELAK